MVFASRDSESSSLIHRQVEKKKKIRLNRYAAASLGCGMDSADALHEDDSVHATMYLPG